MTFQVKDFRSIVLAMINHAKATQEKITDFHVGSVTRTLFEAPAIELDEFYQQVFRGLLDAIPVAIYKAFNHDLLLPASASGFVRFTAANGQADKTIVIPAGFEIYRDDSDVKYVTNKEARLEAGENHVDVRVTATTLGVVGNADIGALTVMGSAIDGISEMFNPKPITGGRDQESENDRKARFIEYIDSLSRGTVRAIVYAAKQATVTNEAGEIIEYVTRVGLNEGPGYVDVYIYGSGGMPSNELINTAQFIIDGGYDAETGTLVPGYRGGGVSVVVSPIVEQFIDVSVQVKTLDACYETDSTVKSIETVLHNLLQSVSAGESITIAELRTAVLSVPGIEKAIIDMDANVVCAVNRVLNIGQLAVEWLQ